MYMNCSREELSQNGNRVQQVRGDRGGLNGNFHLGIDMSRNIAVAEDGFGVDVSLSHVLENLEPDSGLHFSSSRPLSIHYLQTRSQVRNRDTIHKNSSFYFMYKLLFRSTVFQEMSWNSVNVK